MSTTQPIRNYEDLEIFVDYYRLDEPNVRNYAMIQLALNTALRISDILNLKWEDIFDFHKKRLKKHLYTKEKKTGKTTTIALNKVVHSALMALFEEWKPLPQDYLFTKTTDHSKPLNRSTAYRIVKKAAINTSEYETISCHSLRKTFGYYAWLQGAQPALLMDIYNHSSYDITKRYLGIAQDEKDCVFLNINFTSKPSGINCTKHLHLPF